MKKMKKTITLKTDNEKLADCWRAAFAPIDRSKEQVDPKSGPPEKRRRKLQSR